MTKKLTAYFSDSEKAGNAAFDISKVLNNESEIVLGRESSEKAHAFDCCNLSAFIGAAAGTALGLALTKVSSMGVSSMISPFTGLICGSVIGAIIGCIIDFINYEQIPVCSNLTIFLKGQSCARISRQLRRQGALKTVISKGV